MEETMSRFARLAGAILLVHCGSADQQNAPAPIMDGAVGVDGAPALDGSVADQKAEAAPPPQQCTFKASTPSGALDPSFSTKAITLPIKGPYPQGAIFAFSPVNSFFAGMAVDSQHRAIVPGDVTLSTGSGVDPNGKLGTMRINADGTFDSAYGLVALDTFNLVGTPHTVVDSKDRVVVLTSNTLLRLDTTGHLDAFGMVAITGNMLSVDGTDVYLGSTGALVRYHDDGTVDSSFAPSLGQRKLAAFGFTPSCVLALTQPSSVSDPQRLECWKRSDGSLDTTYGTSGFATMPGTYFSTGFVLGQVTGDAIVVRVDGSQTNVDHVTAAGAIDTAYARTFPRAWAQVSSTCGHVFGAWFELAQGHYDGKAQLYHLDALGKDVNPSNALVDSTLGLMDDARFDPSTGQLVVANGVTAFARIDPP